MARMGEIRMWMLRGQGGQVELCPRATDYWYISMLTYAYQEPKDPGRQVTLLEIVGGSGGHIRSSIDDLFSQAAAKGNTHTVLQELLRIESCQKSLCFC